MLFPIKKILVCTDLSDQSDEVLKSAEVLRSRVNGELDILYVSDIDLQLTWASPLIIEDSSYGSFVGNIAKDLKSKLLLQIKKTGVQGTPIFAQGNIFETINKEVMISDKKYDLLVLGHSSKGGLLHNLMGSIARKLVTTASIPTMVIRRPVSFHKIAGLIDDVMPISWMLTSTFDFFRSFRFENIEFISLWHDYPELFHHEHKGPEFEASFREEVQYFVRNGELPIIRFESTSDLHLSDQLVRIMQEDEVSLAVMKKNRGKKINKMVIGSETMRMLETDAVNLLVLPV
jgi:nucleotide-binding universal stress UspA family protein